MLLMLICEPPVVASGILSDQHFYLLTFGDLGHNGPSCTICGVLLHRQKAITDQIWIMNMFRFQKKMASLCHGRARWRRVGPAA